MRCNTQNNFEKKKLLFEWLINCGSNILRRPLEVYYCVSNITTKMIRRTNVFKVLYVKTISITVSNGTKCSNTNPNYLTLSGCITVVNVTVKLILYTPETVLQRKKKHISLTLTLFLFGRKQSEFLLGPKTCCPDGGI
jgi:hypothetical protein